MIGRKQSNLYIPDGFDETRDSKWPYRMVLRETEPERTEEHLISIDTIYAWEDYYGENICVTSLYFSPVEVYFKREQDALEIKLKYA